jgi:N-acetylglucosaminyl-diphospho-decaprenol L-rhamnosyltransferase
VLSVVTVIHGSAPHLADLLSSLDAHLPDHQLVVVDTGPDDGGAAQAHAAGATVIDRPDNPGFGAANNAGVERATHEIVALLNPDVTLLDAGLTRLAAAARDRDALHVPRLLDPAGRPEDSVHPLPGTPRSFARAVTPGPLRRAIGERAPGWATAAALVARTDTLRGLGPFDPAIFLFAEDLDLCLRARAAGIGVELHRDVALRHAGGHSTGPEDAEARIAAHRAVVSRRLGDAAWRRESRALLLEHGLRAFRARDRAYVRAIRRGSSSAPSR